MANQLIIDIGAAANDGTGDPLRTAFNLVNENFSNVWNTGLPTSNVSFSGNRILTVNTNGNLVLAPNGTGRVVANVDIVPNINQAHSLGALNQRWNTVYTRDVDLSGDLVVAGAIDISGDVVVAGNLTVNGNTTTINTSNVDIEDKVITLAFGSPNAVAANGAGISVAGANANIIYNQSSSAWTFLIGGSLGNITAGNISGNFQAPGGNGQVLYNRNGAIGAAPTDFTFNESSQTLFVTTGSFSGNAQTGDNALYVGVPGFTVLGSDIQAQFTGNVNNYTQINHQNANSQPQASGDFVITADNGTDATHFFNMGITSSTWNGEQENSLGNAIGAGWGYLYVQDGGLAIGTKTGNVANVVIFDTLGNITVPGDILPAGNNTQSLGSATNQWKDLWVSNNTIYINSVPISLNADNVLTVNGNDVVTTNSDGVSDISNLAIRGTMISIAGDAILSETGISISPDVESLAYLQIPNNATADTADVRLHNDAGNVEIGTGSGIYNWYFDNTGNLILPEGTPSINYANGQPYSGGANIGNLAVTGTTISIANGAPETTIVVGGTTTAAVEVDTDTGAPKIGIYAQSTDFQEYTQGSGDFTTGEWITSEGGGQINLYGVQSYVDTFMNTLGQYANVSLEINGTETVPYTGVSYGGGTVVLFTTQAPATDPTAVTQIGFILRFNNGILLDPDEGDMLFEIGDFNFNITSQRDVRITASDDLTILGNDTTRLAGNGAVTIVSTINTDPNYTWTFETDGNLTLPSQGNIVGTTPNNTGHLQWVGNSSGDGNGYTTMQLVPDDTVAGNDQYLIIDPTFGPTTGHIHIRAGGTQDNSTADLFLGGENSYVKLPAGSNPAVQLASNNYLWTFNTDGTAEVANSAYGYAQFYTNNSANLYLGSASYPVNIVGSNGDVVIPGTVSANGNISGNYILGNGSQLTGLPASYSNANVANFLAAFGSNTISTTGNITAGNITGNINITGNVTGTSANVTLIAGSYSWTFNNTGNLVLPGNTFAVNYANGTAVSLGGSYGNANVADFLDSLGSNSIVTTGNVTANNFIGNIQLTGNVQGTSANVELVAGSYTWTFDNNGIVTLPAVGGNEGGEINFGIPTANTTLTGPVKVDVYQDRIRFFDGSTKGAYIDMAQAGAGVSTLLNNRVSGFVNAGTFVTMDNIKATVTGSAPRGLSLATVSGSITVNIAATYGGTGGPGGASAVDQTYTTTPSASIFGWNFGVAGEVSTYNISDITNGRAYRITVQIGPSYNNNMISIERLI